MDTIARHPDSTPRDRLLALAASGFEVSRGRPLPLGATVVRGGVNFSLFSRHAASVTLVLFLPGVHEPVLELPLDPRYNRTGDLWHLFVGGINPDVRYAYRIDGPRERGHRYDPSLLVIDPYARALSGGATWGARAARGGVRGGDGVPRRGIVLEDGEFDWAFDEPPRIPLEESVIYELHVRGFTRHDSSAVGAPGTFAGLVEKIPYLKALGVTAVELLPVTEFDELDVPHVLNPLTGERLVNFWGYQPLAFFAPKASYAVDGRHGGQVLEFKQFVHAMHAAGLEVILDMVFNHSGEGSHAGNTRSFRGIDNSTYYIVDPETGAYKDYTGCGNTLNCNHPVVKDLILDSLRYWVTEMHVDGFRFDLASVLGRGRHGEVLASPPLLERIAADPVLGMTKLIAEAWDAAGLYQVGSFPAFGRWAEWNGRFRDDVRRFVRGDAGLASTIATRLAGSPDLYRRPGRGPHHSINFVTCHDGFTLADLVSFDQKQNHANGEDSRDGCGDNASWNCGWEGANAPPDVMARRRQQCRNHLTLLLLSQGVPMLLAGDEFGRSQGGNNNAYCQDNPTSWIDWTLEARHADLLRFVRGLIRFRRAHAALRAAAFFDPHMDGRPSAIWHGRVPLAPDWSLDSRLVVLQAVGEARDELLMAVNMHDQPMAVCLPSTLLGGPWCGAIDTSAAPPRDIVEPGLEWPVDQPTLDLPARAIVVLLAK